MTTESKQSRPLTVDEAIDLADDLLRQLAKLIGDLDALNTVFSHWVDVLGPSRMATVCMAALQTTFADCLTMTPLEDIPAGAATYDTRAIA